MNPNSFFHKRDSDCSLYQIHALHNQINRYNRQISKAREAERRAHAKRPNENAVEQKRDYSFAAASKRKIAAMHHRQNRHHARSDQNEIRGERTHLRFGFVNRGKRISQASHHKSDYNANAGGKRDEIFGGFFRLGILPRTQKLPDNYRNCFSNRERKNIEQIRNRRSYVHGGNNGKSAQRITLVQKSKSHRPKRFVHGERRSFDYDLSQKRRRNFQRLVRAFDELASLLVIVRPQNYDGAFNTSRDNRRNRRAFHAHFWHSEMSENQNVI